MRVQGDTSAMHVAGGVGDGKGGGANGGRSERKFVRKLRNRTQGAHWTTLSTDAEARRFPRRERDSERTNAAGNGSKRRGNGQKMRVRYHFGSGARRERAL